MRSASLLKNLLQLGVYGALGCACAVGHLPPPSEEQVRPVSPSPEQIQGSADEQGTQSQPTGRPWDDIESTPQNDDEFGDACPDDPDKDQPGWCGCGVPDADRDGDGELDCSDECPDDPGKFEPDGCGCGIADVDNDDDGVLDCDDACPFDANKTEPGVCGCGVADVEDEADCTDDCPLDPTKTAPGQCGCGVSDVDGDEDGTPDCTDECPVDGSKVLPGQCGCGVSDADRDGDGVPDCEDLCPSDPNKTLPGECGCGTPEGSCSQCETFLLGGRRLNKGQFICSPSGEYEFGMDADGELLLRSGSTVVWSAEVCCSAAYAFMQRDGNLVVRTVEGAALWSSGTHGNPDSVLSVQDSGRAAITFEGIEVWSTDD